MLATLCRRHRILSRNEADEREIIWSQFWRLMADGEREKVNKLSLASHFWIKTYKFTPLFGSFTTDVESFGCYQGGGGVEASSFGI